MIGKVLSLLRKAASKPIDVVAFRTSQEVSLAWMQRSGGWRRLRARAGNLPAPEMDLTLLHSSVPSLLYDQRVALAGWSEKILASDFEIFGHRVLPLEGCDFSEDWRFSHRWDNRYFREYDFYKHKQTPYDVKMPWELSRMSFLIPVLAHQVVKGADAETVSWITAILQRWERENPLAYSVNWYPMEASMRAVNLVLLLDLARMAAREETGEKLKNTLKILIKQIGRMLFANAAFVWRTREYTDVRGNHFTANIVALYLSGLALTGIAGESKRWRRYAKARVAAEIRLQFLDDGVNFEKACGYHKLVLELFALAAIAAEKNHAPLPEDCLLILEKAACFSDAITRPDGLAANFGDADDACAIPFAMAPARSHGAIVELLRAWRGKPLGSCPFPKSEALAAYFLAGRAAPAPPVAVSPEILQFSSGGYCVARDWQSGFFFVADLGEVGMAGRGGHGHNDILSFELFIDARPVVQDPGCSGYTADLIKKAWFRGTAAHSTVQLFGAEMADLPSPWTVSNHASPRQVSFQQEGYSLTVSACHDGYSRIHQKSLVCRQFLIDPVQQTVNIFDTITVENNDDTVAWHFPCGGVEVQLHGKEKPTEARIGSALLRSQTPLTVGAALFSESYAQEMLGHVVRTEAALQRGQNHYGFSFEKASKGISS